MVKSLRFTSFRVEVVATIRTLSISSCIYFHDKNLWKFRNLVLVSTPVWWTSTAHRSFNSVGAYVKTHRRVRTFVHTHISVGSDTSCLWWRLESGWILWTSSTSGRSPLSFTQSNCVDSGQGCSCVEWYLSLLVIVCITHGTSSFGRIGSNSPPSPKDPIFFQ